MTPEQLRLVQETFAGLAGDVDAVVARIYERLFELAPELRALFPDDLAPIGRSLARTFAALVAELDRFDSLVALAMPLGARNATYGVEPHHYPILGDALQAALAETLGEMWDAELAEAWARGYDLVAEVMLQGATLAD